MILWMILLALILYGFGLSLGSIIFWVAVVAVLLTVLRRPGGGPASGSGGGGGGGGAAAWTPTTAPTAPAGTEWTAGSADTGANARACSPATATDRAARRLTD